MKLTVREIALIGMMVAVIEVSKVALGFLPNIELTSFWLIFFTLFFGRRVAAVVPVFILIEGMMYGFGLWWLMYLYAWPLLVLITWFLARGKSSGGRKLGAAEGREADGQKLGAAEGWESSLTWAILSGAFGLSFGALCAIPYIFIGSTGGGGLVGGGGAGGGLAAGLRTAFAWWVAGIPWDLVHGAGNFVLMLVLFRPINHVMRRVKHIWLPQG